MAHFLGRRLAYTYAIPDLVPGERLVMRTVLYPWKPRTRGRNSVRLAPAGPTLRTRGQPASFSRLTAPVIEQAMRRATRNDLEELKGILKNS